MCCIVLDLEWNQPFSMRSMITTPVRLHGEIIQIGAVKLNEQLEIVDTFKVMVKPKYYPYMHRKISRLTYRMRILRTAFRLSRPLRTSLPGAPRTRCF